MKEPLEKYKHKERLELDELVSKDEKIFKKVCCPSCDKEVVSDNLNLQNKVAKCGGCNAVFSIEEDLKTVSSKKEIKQAILRPEGIDLFHFQDDLDITVDQYIQGADAWGIVMLPIFAVFSILIYFFSDKVDLSPYVPILFSLPALYFIYKGVNYHNSKYKTYIEINDKFLSIKHRPSNFRKDVQYDSNDIDQVYLKHSVERHGFFTVHIIVNGIDGQQHKKLLSISSLSKAKYLEQEIEKYLNIEDRKVPEATV